VKAILDTGVWVALIDKSEACHDICVEWFKDYHGRLFSSEAVLTEVLYLFINKPVTCQKIWQRKCLGL